MSPAFMHRVTDIYMYSLYSVSLRPNTSAHYYIELLELLLTEEDVRVTLTEATANTTCFDVNRPYMSTNRQ